MSEDGKAREVASDVRQRLVYVVDDDIDVQKSLHFLLASMSISACPFVTAPEFIDQLPDLAPAPILLDIRMPTIDGLQVLGLLKERAIFWPVIVITAHGNVGVAVRAMKLGATEFIEKPFSSETLDQALSHAFSILHEVERSLHAREVARRLIDGLTRREREVVNIMLEGAPNKLIAHRLGITVRTVEMHRGKALSKLKAKSVIELIALMESANIPKTSAYL